jgi:hypothetical protein
MVVRICGASSLGGWLRVGELRRYLFANGSAGVKLNVCTSDFQVPFVITSNDDEGT